MWSLHAYNGFDGDRHRAIKSVGVARNAYRKPEQFLHLESFQRMVIA